MTITQVVTTLPAAPDPATMTRDAFSTAAAAYVLAQKAMVPELNTWAGQANALTTSLNAIAAGTAVGIPYTFSTTTTDADPGAGFLRLDNATQNAATTIRADLSGNDASVWTDVLNTLDDSTSTIKGHVRLVKNGDATKWLIFTVSALASPSGYKNITVANVASSAASPFANNDNIVFEFTRTGDKGDTGATGAGIIADAVGWHGTAGTTPKTLIVDVDLTTSAVATLTGAETLNNKTITLDENTGLIMDPALSADGRYCGVVEAGTAGAALAFGELCYFQTADSRWEKSKAAAADIATANLRLGMCVLAAAGDGSATTMLLYGKIRADSLFPAMTIGAPVYMSAATAGVITSTAPTGTTDFTVRKVGFAATADELFFNPSNDYLTLA